MLRTAGEYLTGLNDGREVYFRGERVESVCAHPELGIAARHAALEYTLAENPEHREIAVVGRGDSAYSAYYHVPSKADDLDRRSKLIAAGTRAGGTLVLLIKEIGTDALYGLMRVLARNPGDAEGLGRVRRFHAKCQEEDLSLAVAQTDVKGDRSARPGKLTDPDLYVRCVDQDHRGIVVRGAKVHTSCAAYVDWIIVLPGRSLMPDESQWGVSFAVPVATPGVRLYASDFLTGDVQPLTQPITASHRMVETLTVFDDVFVPWERVFFAGRADLAGQTALAFVEFHRFTAVSYKVPLLDAFVGGAAAVAQANGIFGAAHVRDKLAWLVAYAESVKGLLALAGQRARIEAEIAYPDPVLTNTAKWLFARDYHEAVGKLQDLAGGLLVTGPSDQDLVSALVRPVIDKYLAAGWPAEDRLRVMNLVSELTARGYGGYQAVLASHAEGSIEAEKMALLRAFDFEPSMTYVRSLARGEFSGAAAASVVAS